MTKGISTVHLAHRLAAIRALLDRMRLRRLLLGAVSFCAALGLWAAAPVPPAVASVSGFWAVNSYSVPTYMNAGDATDQADELVVTGATDGTYELRSESTQLGRPMTGPIEWDATPVEVRQAIESGFQVSGISVGGSRGSYLITWSGSVSGQGVYPQPVESELAGAGSVSVTQLTAPETTDLLRTFITNRSDHASQGAITVTETLPPQINPVRVRFESLGLPPTGEGREGHCQTIAQTVSCTYSESILPQHQLELLISAALTSTSYVGPLSTPVTAESSDGTGAAVLHDFANDPAPAFGIDAFGIEAASADGSTETRAGAHPYAVTATADLNSEHQGRTQTSNSESLFSVVQDAKNLVFELPLGFSGDPLAARLCPQIDLTVEEEGENAGRSHTDCPAGSKVGILSVQDRFGIPEPDGFPIYDLIPTRGYPAEFGVNIGLAAPVLMYATVIPTPLGDRLRVTAHGIISGSTANLVKATATFFGVPGEHNGSGSTAAFLTDPTRCSAGASQALLEAASWEGGLASAEAIAYPSLTGCSAFKGASSFAPSVHVAPDNAQADSPAGLHVGLRVPQAPDVPGILSTPQLKDAAVQLPPGLAVNPSSASGLVACQATGSQGINLQGTEIGNGYPGGNSSPYDDGLLHSEPGHCPAASTLGTVEVTTPLLEEPLKGNVYIGAPECAPCTGRDAEEGRLVKLYLEVSGSGVIVKLPGSGELSPSGQITGVFKENPQLPFEELKLDFKSGPRAPLTSPPTCGVKTTTSDLEPWSAPETPDATPTSSFEITSGAGGSACPNGEAGEPDSPSFEAGTLTPIAGSYSPFVLKLSREDGSQRISSIDATLPEGLVGKLAGIPYCSDSRIAAAAALGGREEQAAPSCPLASEVGTVNVGAGSGPDPFYVQGHAYLAGPYKGAPISLAIITPAVAGPFDLGTVVVRTALYVNETTAQIHAVSDLLPTVLAGIPLDIRSIALNMNRPQFTLNPTSCDPMSVLGAADTTAGQTATFSNRFQVGACKALAFKPDVKLSLKGSTKRAGVPALKAVLTYPKGQNANVKDVSVVLPRSEFIDQAHIGNTCTRVQFNAGAGHGAECPANSVLGHALAYTPLLEKPLEGTVYLRSNGGERELPDIVAALKGQIDITLVGFVDSVKKSKHSEVSRIRTRFMNAPDAPVSRFVLQLAGAKHGLLQNSRDLCRSSEVAQVKATAQDNATYDIEPVVAGDCGKGSKGKKRQRHVSHRVGSSHR